MRTSYVQKRKPGRPAKEVKHEPPFEEVAIKEASQGVSLQNRVPDTLQEQALSFLKTETLYLQDGIPEDLFPAVLYHRCGSVSMFSYFKEKDMPTLHSFVRWLTRTNQIHFDKIPTPGDVLFLHNNGTIIACRLVLDVKEEEVQLSSLYPFFPTHQHASIERARAGMKKKYTVTLHNWHEKVTSWYAVGKVID